MEDVIIIVHFDCISVHIDRMICNLKFQNVENLESDSYRVEDLESDTDRDPVYSYTRQQLTAKTIRITAPKLYTRMEALQKQLSLVFHGLQPGDERFLREKRPNYFDFSVLAAIPSNGAVPK